MDPCHNELVVPAACLDRVDLVRHLEAILAYLTDPDPAKYRAESLDYRLDRLAQEAWWVKVRLPNGY